MAKNKVTFAHLYKRMKKEWVLVGYRCMLCSRPFAGVEAKDKHKDKCTRINTR